LLDEECAGDDELRRHVDSLLLSAEDRIDDFSEASIRSSRDALEEILAGGEDAVEVADVAHEADLGTDGSPYRIGPYRILRRIGMGGMGVVFEAEQEAPRRRVALKLLHPLVVTYETRRRFRLEAELLGRLQHPNIAQVFESGSYAGEGGVQPFFAMEFVDGTDLRTYAARERLDARAFLRLFASVCGAVHHAHERGVVHRDLKPENILVDANGAPKVLDFGVARATDSSAMLTTMVTDRGELLGTLAYMAPEQLGGDPDTVTAAADVYALGVIAFEILGGRLPFEVAGLPISVAIRIVSEDDPARLGALEPVHRGDVEVIIGKAMERDPRRR